MGSKNRINLGYIMELVLHFHRNFYYSTKIYMSKRVQTKIKEKHRDVKTYTELHTFQLLMQHTIAFYPYNKCEDTMNFIVHIDNKFVLYALKREKHHTSCNTIYVLNAKTLKKLYRQDSFKIIKQEYNEIIERVITD
jgi:hypothetical protein